MASLEVFDSKMLLLCSAGIFCYRGTGGFAISKSVSPLHALLIRLGDSFYPVEMDGLISVKRRGKQGRD